MGFFNGVFLGLKANPSKSNLQSAGESLKKLSTDLIDLNSHSPETH